MKCKYTIARKVCDYWRSQNANPRNRVIHAISGDFRKQLESLLNCANMENRSDTPDFILAQYMTDCLEAYDRAVNRREVWFGRKKAP